MKESAGPSAIAPSLNSGNSQRVRLEQKPALSLMLVSYQGRLLEKGYACTSHIMVL